MVTRETSLESQTPGIKIAMEWYRDQLVGSGSATAYNGIMAMARALQSMSKYSIPMCADEQKAFERYYGRYLAATTL